MCVCAWEGSVNKNVARFKLSLMEEFEQKEKNEGGREKKKEQAEM